jgi:hypothetical protein
MEGFEKTEYYMIEEEEEDEVPVANPQKKEFWAPLEEELFDE